MGVYLFWGFVILFMGFVSYFAVNMWNQDKREKKKNEELKQELTIPVPVNKIMYMPLWAWFNNGNLLAMGGNRRYIEVGKTYVIDKSQTGFEAYKTIECCFEKGGGPFGSTGSATYNKDEVIVCRVMVIEREPSYSRGWNGMQDNFRGIKEEDRKSYTTKNFQVLEMVSWDVIEKEMSRPAYTNYHLDLTHGLQQKLKETSIKGYKAFDRQSSLYNGLMNCKGRPYEIGKTYTASGRIVICKNGYHFCTKLTDCFRYYNNVPGIVICEVEGSDLIVKDTRSDDSKHCAKTIKIVRELSLAEINKVLEEELPVFKEKTE